jgi:aspartyl-tRNA(Asn)/glutamyl-tRNA(Gln) amidotransferase subunit B
MAAWEAVIGLEVHAQLMTKTKIFCFVPNSYGVSENAMVGPVSGGLPGALPVLNDHAVELAVRAGLALNCKLNKRSVFSRKNYFYPDLPKGYQISQFDEPVCGEGHVDIPMDDKSKRIGIERIHMEEDAGKSIHQATHTLVNLNRSGVPLIEIVSRPDMRSPFEAGAYLRKVHSILVYGEICDGNMEEGNFRCDANVSVRPMGQTKLGTRCELKNINSFRFIEKAIEYEINRQIALIESGGRVVQETRGFDSGAGKTFLMRSKEDAHDYRYFPEPDLPPLVLTDGYIEDIRRKMPELPEQKKARFVSQYGLTELDARELTTSRDLADYFEKAAAGVASPRLAANWILSEILRGPNSIKPEELSALLRLVEKGTISGKIAKTVFEEMFVSGGDPEKIVQEKGLVQVLDSGAIDAWVDQVLAASPSQVAEYKAGKEKVFSYFVGEVMKLSRGKANPQLLSETLKKKLA